MVCGIIYLEWSHWLSLTSSSRHRRKNLTLTAFELSFLLCLIKLTDDCKKEKNRNGAYESINSSRSTENLRHFQSFDSKIVHKFFGKVTTLQIQKFEFLMILEDVKKRIDFFWNLFNFLQFKWTFMNFFRIHGWNEILKTELEPKLPCQGFICYTR